MQRNEIKATAEIETLKAAREADRKAFREAASQEKRKR